MTARAWVRDHVPHCLTFVLAVAGLLRVFLILGSPRPWGYVWDRYHRGIQLLYATGELPESVDCIQCYHPPLYYYAGQPFYWLGEQLMGAGADPAELVPFLGGLSLLAVAVVLFYMDRLVTTLRLTGEYRVLAAAVAAAVPCLFISSWSVEADILLTAILCAFAYHLVRYFQADETMGSSRRLVLLGVLAGLAAATKYNGVLALVVGGVSILWKTLPQGRLTAAVTDVALFAAIAVGIGGWKYLDNYAQYDTPLFANGTASEGFSIERDNRWGDYEFTTFPLLEAVDLMSPDSEDGRLTDMPPYRSVWGTLHMLLWSDMSFFSRSTRHGGPFDMYPTKHIPLWLPRSVVLLAVLPGALAVLGLLVTLRRRDLLPLHLLTGFTWAVYLQWFVAQPEWGLKTKYILFLLAPYLVYLVAGLQWLEARVPSAIRTFCWVWLAALVILTNAYMLVFSVT